MISLTNIYYVQFKHVHNSSYNYNYRFPMKRTHEDTIESHKRRKEEEHMPVRECVEQKRHHQDSYDSQLNVKKPNLDIQGPLQTSSYGQSKPGMYNIYITIYTVCIS